MRILILGATGRTGKLVLAEALQRGHTVHAVVRDKNKFEGNDPGLTLFEGSPADKVILEKAMIGCEAVLSALNISRKNDWPWARLKTPKKFLSSVMRHIIQLAPRYGIERIIFTSAWGAGETRKDVPGWFRWFIERSNIRYPYDDHTRQEDLVKLTSLQWTAVRPSGLTNFKREKEILVSFNNDPKPRLTISRRNVARFMLDVLEKYLYVRQMPVVSEM